MRLEGGASGGSFAQFAWALAVRTPPVMSDQPKSLLSAALC